MGLWAAGRLMDFRTCALQRGQVAVLKTQSAAAAPTEQRAH